MQEIKPYYLCDQCQHQYSIYLSKKCPKCGNIYLEEHINIDVVVPVTIERFKITVSKDGLQEKGK